MLNVATAASRWRFAGRSFQDTRRGPDQDVRSAYIVAITFVLVVGILVLGLTHISGLPLSADGSDSLRYATTPGVAGLSENGGDMALYYLLLKVLVRMFGATPFVVRLPSVVFAAATVPVVEELGRRIWNRRVGLLSAVLCGVSLPLLDWARAGRGYMLGTFLVSAAVLCWIVLERRPGALRAAAFVGTSTLATYALLLNWWVLLGELGVWGFWCLAARRGRPHAPTGAALRWLAASLALVALWSAQLAVIALNTGMSRFVASRNQVTPQRLAHTLTVLASAASGGVGTTAWALPAALLTLGTIVLWVAGATKPPGGRSEPAADRSRAVAVSTLALWLVTPAIGQLGVSLLVHPMYQYRYFIMCLPAAALLAAAGLDRLRARGTLPYAVATTLLVGAHAVFVGLAF